MTTTKKGTSTIDKLKAAALAAWSDHADIGHKSITAMRAAGDALGRLQYAIGNADEPGGFKGWCEANGVARQTAIRYANFARDYAAVAKGTHGAEGRKALAEAPDVAEARRIINAALRGQDAPPVARSVTGKLTATINDAEVVDVGRWLAGLAEMGGAVVSAVKDGRVDADTLADATAKATALVKLAEEIRRVVADAAEHPATDAEVSAVAERLATRKATGK